MRGVIFDLDGVVVYTDTYHFLGWKRLADEEGWDFDESLNDQLRGVSRMASLQIILDHNGLDMPEDQKHALATRKNEYYKASLATIDEDALVPGAIDFVRAVREAGLKTGLGSSSKNARTVLDSLGITGLFDAIVTGHDITRSKPDPQIFQLVTERLGLAPDECAVFEDAESGVAAALAGGMYAVGFGSQETLGAAHAVVQRYDQIDLSRFIATGTIERSSK
jgi:beta-phosphoglucomutase